MRGHGMLILGVAAIAAVLGYMVGGSATPVVQVAVPAVFGLVVTAIGILQAAPNKELLEAIRAFGDKADAVPEIVEMRARLAAAPARIGLTLFVFSLSYIIAATIGGAVRVNQLLAAPRAPLPFPWAPAEMKPPTISSALQWIALQERLRELGYEEAGIRELYAIQVAEWKKNPNAAAPSAGESKPAVDWLAPPRISPGGPTIAPGGPIAPPFAHQPREQLREQLRRFPPGLMGKDEVKG